MAERLSGPAARGAAGLGRDPAPARRGRAPVHEQGRPPRVLRVRPVRRHVAGGARRPDRQRHERLRGLVDGGRGAEPGRARGDRLVQGLARLPGGGRRAPRQRRLGGEPHGARVRARGAGRLDVRRPRRLRLRPGAFVGRASRARPRLPAEPGSRDPDGRRSSRCASTCSSRRWRPTSRPVASRSSSPRTAAPRTAAPSTRWKSSSSSASEQDVWLHVDAAYGGFAVLDERGRRQLAGIEDADSITLDPHKWLYQPYECGCLLVSDGAELRNAFTITPDYLKEASRGRQRGQLLRPRPAADQDGARVQGLVLDPVLRARRVPARDRADVRARRARGDADRGQRPARARGAAVPRDRQLPAALRRETRTC